MRDDVVQRSEHTPKRNACMRVQECECVQEQSLEVTLFLSPYQNREYKS